MTTWVVLLIGAPKRGRSTPIDSGTSLIPTLTPSLDPIEEVNEASCQAIGVLKDVLKKFAIWKSFQNSRWLEKVFRIQDD